MKTPKFIKQCSKSHETLKFTKQCSKSPGTPKFAKQCFKSHEDSQIHQKVLKITWWHQKITSRQTMLQISIPTQLCPQQSCKILCYTQVTQHISNTNYCWKSYSSWQLTKSTKENKEPQCQQPNITQHHEISYKHHKFQAIFCKSVIKLWINTQKKKKSTNSPLHVKQPSHTQNRSSKNQHQKKLPISKPPTHPEKNNT